jgi:hypothetical protein
MGWINIAIAYLVISSLTAYDVILYKQTHETLEVKKNNAESKLSIPYFILAAILTLGPLIISAKVLIEGIENVKYIPTSKEYLVVLAVITFSEILLKLAKYLPYTNNICNVDTEREHGEF